MVSTGKGPDRAAISPDGNRIVYSSTHLGSPDCHEAPDRAVTVWPLYKTFDISRRARQHGHETATANS
jgi:hypothetical protein